MGHKIVTEADRRATPRPAGARSHQGGGQKLSRERGAHSHHKKNPGKRPHAG